MGHESEELQRVKRRVSYNQEVTLCPDCKKRIRLNNDGRVRKHVSGKAGSPECRGSDAAPTKTYISKDGMVLTDKDIEALADEAEAGYDPSQLKPRTAIFSDQK